MPYRTTFDIFTFEAIFDDAQLSERDEIADIIDMYGDFDDAASVIESSRSRMSRRWRSQLRQCSIDANKASEVYENFFFHVDQLVEFEDFNHTISFKTANATPALVVIPATPKKSKATKTFRAPVNPPPFMALPPTPPRVRELKSQQRQVKPLIATSKRARRVVSPSMLNMMLSIRRQ
ncbi:hypothetical protein MPER_08908 [Moniliophthora perniciosa FA553]|nr:hypothetical protein MPER_08908 [Moniliophthora perniciosa FA553]